MKLKNHLHLVPSLRIRGALSLLPHASSCTFNFMRAILFVISHVGFEVVTEAFLNFQHVLNVTQCQLVKSH